MRPGSHPGRWRELIGSLSVALILVAVAAGAMSLNSVFSDAHHMEYVLHPHLTGTDTAAWGGALPPGAARMESVPVVYASNGATGLAGVGYRIYGPERTAGGSAPRMKLEVERADAELTLAVQTLALAGGLDVLSIDRVGSGVVGSVGFIAIGAFMFALILGVYYRRLKTTEPQYDRWATATEGASGTATGIKTESARATYIPHKARVSFNDIAGMEPAKRELTEVVDFLKDPEGWHEFGAEVPRGVLLWGEPGNGKTLLARAVASEAKVPFFTRSGSEFVEMYVGVGAKRVRELFDEARKAPEGKAVIFIDEVDALVRRRGGNSNAEGDQTLNQLLSEMDGIERNSGIIVIGATNRMDTMDSAVLRPGRFTRHVHVPQPDVKSRREILEVHRKKRPFVDIDWDALARKTTNFSGAQLQNLLNEASIHAKRKARGDKKIHPEDVKEAWLKVLGGHEAPRVMSDALRRRTAYHEAGHALVKYVLSGERGVEHVSIVSRSEALGVTFMANDMDDLPLESEFRIMLAAASAGRAAEDLIDRNRSVGASNDFTKVAEIARKMVTTWGMGEQTESSLGLDLYLADEYGRAYSQATAVKIDEQVHRIVENAYRNAQTILLAHRPQLDAVVEALLEQEDIEGSAFEEIVNTHGGIQVQLRELVDPHATEATTPAAHA